MLLRSTFRLLASCGVLFLAGATGLTPTWSLVTGTVLLTTASLLLAVALEARDLRPWTPNGGTRTFELVPLAAACPF